MTKNEEAKMTLIRGTIVDDKIIIVSDTKLSYPPCKNEHYNENNYVNGTVKSIILSPNICLSFAGDLDVVKSALKKISNLKDINKITEILLEVNTEHYNKNPNKSADFLLAYVDGGCNLVEIKNACKENKTNSWLGSHRGFSAYQKYFNEYNNISFGSSVGDESFQKYSMIFSRMTESIKKIIDDGNINEVGGIYIAVVYIDGTFKYMPYATVYFSPMQVVKNGQPLKFASVEEGGFSLNLFSSNIDGLAVHMYHGQLGILFHKSNHLFMETKVYYPYDIVEFTDEMKQQYNIDESIGIQSNHELYYKNANKYLELDINKAIRFLTKAIELLRIRMLEYDIGIEAKENSLEYFSKFDQGAKKLLCLYYFNLGVCYYKKKDFFNAKKNWINTLIIDNGYNKAIKALIEVSKEI